MLPRIGTVNSAEELKFRMPVTPTMGLPEPLPSLYKDVSGVPIVELTSSIPRVPLIPFCGAKYLLVLISTNQG